MNERFTPAAAALWSTVPAEVKPRILKKVFCVQCRCAVEIVNFSGEEERGDLILTGQCARCGHAVVRVIETSEMNWGNN